MSEVQSAVILGQLERINELVEIRKKVGAIFDSAIEGCEFIKKQYTPEYCVNSYWGYAMILETTNPVVDWYRFRDLFQKNGGDGYYAAWKLTYQEKLFTDEIQKMQGVLKNINKDCVPMQNTFKKGLLL
jgi:perosamine synthetase